MDWLAQEQTSVNTGYGHRKGVQYMETQWRERRASEATRQQMLLDLLFHTDMKPVKRHVVQTRAWRANISNRGWVLNENFSWKIPYQQKATPFLENTRQARILTLQLFL